jgi:hypothetical protein|tara:strand:- start:738 stop:1151 length:414 start_codon:yes stop_codon:yes gene_type:complete
MCSGIAEADESLRYPFFEMLLNVFTKKEVPKDALPVRKDSGQSGSAVVPFCDEQEYERVVDQYYKLLYVFALSLTKSEHDAWDLTHDTYARWARSQHKIKDKSKTKSWLFSTLYDLKVSAKNLPRDRILTLVTITQF